MTGALVAVGSTSTQKITTSPDAVTWTAQGQGGWTLGHNPLDICYSPSLKLWAAVAPLANGVYTSSDGLSWTQDASSTSFAPRAIAWSGDVGIFVAVGASLGIASSPDGTTWTNRLTGSGIYTFNAVYWSPDAGLFMAVGTDSTGGAGPCYTSPDGVTWTAKAAPIMGTVPFTFYRAVEDVTYAPSLGAWLAVGGSGDVGKSTDNGSTWTKYDTPVVLNLFSVAWSESVGKFVTSDTSAVPHYSSDGQTWSTGSGTCPSNDIEWVDDLGLYVAVGDGGAIATSANGTSWTSRTSGHAQQINAVAWGAAALRGWLLGAIPWN